MPTPPVPVEELQKDVDAYIAAGGNRSEAARMRNLPRRSYCRHLEFAQKALGVQLGKIVDGRVDAVRARKLPLPKGKSVARYILSACQNNTHPHKEGLRNILAYRDWLNKRRGDTCDFMLGSFSYALDAYGAKAVKRGAYRPQGELWYSPELVPFITDESVQLAPGLIWCGEMNILPTATNPLTGLDTYNGRSSNIFPHAKHALESVASLADEATKFNYTTGCITLRNYIQKRAGIIAEQSHSYGAVLVEVDAAGNWYVRQLILNNDGVVYDIGPSGYRGVRVAGGKVDAITIEAPPERTFVEAITWGDIHAAEMDLWVRILGWSRGGVLDQLAPRKQFFHDIFSMRSRSHHEFSDFHRQYAKHAAGEDSVKGEMEVTADFMRESSRPWCETIVVRSNHDKHLEIWLNKSNPAFDLANAKYFYELQNRLLAAIDEGDAGFNILEWALRQEGIPDATRFLDEDESYVICKEAGGIECGLHGHLGPNGAPGSTRSLTKLGRPANKAHDHRATIQGPVFSAGACSMNFAYMRGPHAHSVSHILTFENASRQILTMWDGKVRA